MTDHCEKPNVKRAPQWPAVRRAHLAVQPACAACGAREQLEVHHKVPLHVDPSLELEPSNLITLCERPTLNCHLWCGHLGHWRSWNTKVVRDAARFLARVLRRPFK